MSYQSQAGISDLANKAMDLWSKAKPVVDIGSNVLGDPYLPAVACEVGRLSKASAGVHPGPRCAAPVAPKGAGVGLRYVINPLRVYVWHRQYPWAIPLIGAAALVGIYYAGYSSGKKKRS